MNLGLCIVNLLRQYPEVTVPGIGVFKKTPVAASFDAQSNVFLPPSSRIDLIDADTGGVLLTDYLKAQQQMNEENASHLLDEVVQELLATARRNGKVLLSGLGYLIADGASLVFEQLNSANLGFRQVNERQAVTPEVADIPVTVDPQPVEETTVVTEGPDTMFVEEGLVDEDEPVGRRSVWWVAAVLGVMVLSAVGVWLFKPAWLAETRWSSFSDRTEVTTPVPVAAPATRAPSVANRTDSLAGVAVQEAASGKDSLAKAAPQEAAPVEAVRPSVTYEVIVGSFETMQQAEKYVNRMKAKGYTLTAIESRMPGNRKKVSWASFATEEEAYRELVHVQKNFQPEAWIAKVVHD